MHAVNNTVLYPETFVKRVDFMLCIFFFYHTHTKNGGSGGKESACSVGDLGSILVLGRSPGGGHGNLLQVFFPGESPWTEEPAGLQFIGVQRATTNSTLC